jgi:kinesin family protein 18/19
MEFYLSFKGAWYISWHMTYLILQIEVCRLKKELAAKESQLSVKPADKAADDELSWLNILSHEISENVQERINLQKALFELEETNLCNRTELQHLDDAIAKQQVR